MEATVSLKHVNHSLPARTEYWYDGLAVARDGLITLPAVEVEHLRAAFFRGYQLTSDGRLLADFQDLDSYIEEQTAKSAEGGHIEPSTIQNSRREGRNEKRVFEKVSP